MKSTLFVFPLLFVLLWTPAMADPDPPAKTDFDRLHPHSSGYIEDAPGAPASIAFQAVREESQLVLDMVVNFPKEQAVPFRVDEVTVNGTAVDPFQVRNANILNGHRLVNGMEDFSVSLYSGWAPGVVYEVKVSGLSPEGKVITRAQSATAPASRSAEGGLSYAIPDAEFPYHHASMTLAKEAIGAGTVTRVEVDGIWNRDARFFNTGIQNPPDATNSEGLDGETYTGQVDGSRDFRIVAPVAWTAGSQHTMRVVVNDADGKETVYEAQGKAPEAGAYWNGDWPHYASILLKETAGVGRPSEPVHIALGLFADEVTDIRKELRVVTYDPTHPQAGADGYVVAPHQVVDVVAWHDEAMLNKEERDAETGELVHRYDATTTVEFVFLADVQPYEEKVYLAVFGNPNAQETPTQTKLSVTQGQALAQTISNPYYAIGTASNSGAVETVTVLGEGDPVLLEHKLETNGAVHWNPGFYSPPTPWVHASDWEAPDFEQISGALMHRTRRHAMLPFMDSVSAHVSYTFYSGQPYILFTSLMEAHKEHFVAALRNSELVFNHAVLNEFVWLDEMGTVKSLDIETAKLHPVHALDIPANTPWMAFISREAKVGFANILLGYENTNRYGDPASEAQPYIYVQNGPWIYWSRGIVYPFAGNNMTRLMRVRKGSMYYEKNAWLPFRLAEGHDPFKPIEDVAKKLTNPLVVLEWMPTNKRAPEKWVMPILTMPFDEGVAGAVSAHKKTGEE